MRITPWHRSVHLLLLPLWACAGPDGKTPPPTVPYQRIVLYTAGEFPGTAEVTNRTARLAGVPVRDTMELGARRYRMTLLCADHDACRAAMARIAADRQFALGVDADGRVQIPAKPSRDASR